MTSIIKLKLVVILLCLLNINTYAQSYSSESKAAIKNYEKGVENLESRKYEEATSYFEKAIQKDQNFVEAYLMLAELNFEKNNLDEAVLWYENAVKTNPDFYPPAYLILGKIHLQSGNYKNQDWMAPQGLLG